MALAGDGHVVIAIITHFARSPGGVGRDGAGHNCNGAHSYSREKKEREVREERGREKREGKGGGVEVVSIKALPY
jgi:hypothetical protein